ncbi:succinylglutamate desuccinylase/aspartoacylase [Halovivax asiaticus JCM 14624]|uniref:Succinylglutamate desuccinylase/aspartoacylase n=1 Tax=Halovivax asiaticus JCM 14624 TaxID=1227490 RepID=M0BRH5_9EURY|nr:succinylglutamate desuccinylase/aspartoacylase family protein [Halovivax asiaticus]ELZ12727.1 succinylglutamate desuccinylase/aspartoacylase [Halovivax asiaticus JCM 14624]
MAAGTHTAARISLATLPSGVEVATTIHTYDGATDGPTLYVQAAQHGREVNGTAVLRRFHDRVPRNGLAGRIVAVPVANPLTFDRVSYTTPEIIDSVNPNMNRVWPGDDEGSLHQRMAATLWEYVETADAVVDLHTGSPDMYPHVVYLDGSDRSRALANAFGTDLLLGEEAGEDATDEWHRRGFAGKLRVVADREGIPSITPELAHNREIVDDVVEAGVDGLLDVCRHLGMLDGSVPARDQTVARNHLGQVTASASGLFRPKETLELGDSIPAGAAIGTVYDPTTYETLQNVATDRAGILYALTREATVTAGDKLASVAIVRDE